MPGWENKRGITVHPLGGCHMGTDASNGVTNHKGQFFNCENQRQSQDVYSGLIATDGLFLFVCLLSFGFCVC